MNGVPLLLIEVTVVFALALLSVRLASGARAAVRHLILTSAFGVALILPLATLVHPPLVLEIPSLPARAADSSADTPAAAAPVKVESNGTGGAARTAVALTKPAISSIPAATWLLLSWAIVALMTLVPVVASLLQLRSIRRRGQPWSAGMAQMNTLAQAAGMQAPLVLLHNEIAGPITSGVMRPVIVLPSGALKWSQTHVGNALVHELAHVRRRDWPVHLISRTVCALYWVHPLAWIAWRMLRLEAERACDDAVLAQEDAATYAEQLLELARHLAHKPAPGLSMASSSDLSSRIRSILDTMRPRGRASKVVITCTALAAVAALAVLASLRIAEDLEVTMVRAAEVLAKRSDPDSLAAAGLFLVKRHDQSLLLLAQASQLAPERADLVWLHLQVCQTHASCDPVPLERRLRELDGSNGAGWFGELDRASKSGDEEAKSAALAAVGRSERVDIYWTTLIARLSGPIASTKVMSLIDAEVGVIGVLAAQLIPSYKVMADACKGERLQHDDRLEVCRGIANALLNGDTVITEMIGSSIAKLAWPEDSSKWVEAHRKLNERNWRVGEASSAWIESHPRDFLVLLGEHRREQDLQNAVLTAAGMDPAPR